MIIKKPKTLERPLAGRFAGTFFFVFLVFLVFQGLIVNYSRFNLGFKSSFLVQIPLVLILLFMPLVLGMKRGRLNQYGIFVFLVVFYILLAALFFDIEPMQLAQIYIMFVGVLYFVFSREASLYLFSKWSTILLFLPVVVGYSQVLFPETIPNWFAYAPSFVEAERRDAIWILGSPVFRPNGLIGNPIEFASYCLLLQVYFILPRELNKIGGVFRFLAISLVSVIIFLTFSRLAIVINACLIIYYLAAVVQSRALSYSVTFLIILSSFSALYFSGLSVDELKLLNFMVGRFNGEDELTRGSNLEHLREYEVVFEVVTENWTTALFGKGVGSNLNGVFISDGFVFSVLIELGIVGAISYALIFCWPVFSMVRDRRRYIFLLLSIFFVCSLINSAFLNKTVMVFYWMLLSALWNSYRSQNEGAF